MRAGRGREHHSMSMRVSQTLFIPSESARVQNGVEMSTGGWPRGCEAAGGPGISTR